ncbi:hypothetical protein TNCV_2436511 [Trichonephila clavipes]|nr:hypothetical protein TNCV_2436511 [Trichonephila clavipes]
MIWLSSPPNFEEEHPGGWSEASHLSSSLNLVEARRIFRVPTCRTGTIHLQTPMPSTGFIPRPYGTAFNVTNQAWLKVTC